MRKMRTRIIHVDSKAQVASAAQQGAEALRGGKLVGFATETVYGIAVLATNGRAMSRLRALKSRPKRPFSVHVAAAGEVARYVDHVPPQAARLISKAWPGAITLVLPCGAKLADRKLHSPELRGRLCQDNFIGLRCPDEPVALAMLAKVSGPVVASSANLAGGPSPRRAEEVLDALDGRIDLLIDSGPTRLGTDSTIIRFNSRGWKVLRKGSYDDRAIDHMLRRKLLLVCTGNTCRSPMAAGLAKKLLAEKESCKVGELRKKGIGGCFCLRRGPRDPGGRPGGQTARGGYFTP